MPGAPLHFRPQPRQQHLLGIGLLHQRTPELTAGVGVAVDELVVDGGQPVIDDHIHPLAEAPEVEVEDSRVGLRLLRIPFLLLPVWDDLDGERDQDGVGREGMLVSAGRSSHAGPASPG